MTSHRTAIASIHRRTLTGAILAAAIVFAPEPSNAQAYPTRPVKIVIPYAPGGIPDAAGRLIAEKLAGEFGHPFFVENRPGAGGITGVAAVTASEPDGYTLLVGATGTLTISPNIYKNIPFKLADLTPISLVGAFEYVMLSAPAMGKTSVSKVVDFAKKNPDKLKIASSGNGSEHHLLIELFKQASGAPLVHVPYKGFSQGVVDVLGDRVELLIASIPAAESFVLTGKLGALAVTGSKRNNTLVNVPTFAELGYPEVQMTSWIGLLAPAQTPRPVLQKLTTAMEKILQSQDVAARMAKLGAIPIAPGPKAFADQMQADTKRYRDIIARGNIEKIE